MMRDIFLSPAPKTLQEAVYRLYAFSHDERDIQFLKGLKQLYLNPNGLLVDEEGMKYQRPKPVAIIDVMFGGALKSLEVKKIRAGLFALRGKANSLLEIAESEEYRKVKIPDFDDPSVISHEEDWRVVTYKIELYNLEKGSNLSSLQN